MFTKESELIYVQVKMWRAGLVGGRFQSARLG